MVYLFSLQSAVYSVSLKTKTILVFMIHVTKSSDIKVSIMYIYTFLEPSVVTKVWFIVTEYTIMP